MAVPSMALSTPWASQECTHGARTPCTYFLCDPQAVQCAPAFAAAVVVPSLPREALVAFLHHLLIVASSPPSLDPSFAPFRSLRGHQLGSCGDQIGGFDSSSWLEALRWLGSLFSMTCLRTNYLHTVASSPSCDFLLHEPPRPSLCRRFSQRRRAQGTAVATTGRGTCHRLVRAGYAG